MEYYVVDKCIKAREDYKLDIYSEKNNKIGAILNPIKCTQKGPASCPTLDFTKPVKHILYENDYECSKNKMKGNFNKLYVKKDIDVSPYIVGNFNLKNGYYYDSSNINTVYMRGTPFTKSYHPKIVLTYTITTKRECRPSECYEVEINDKEYIHSFKPDNFENNIELHFIAHKSKDVTFSDKKCEKGTAFYTIETKLSGTSKIIFNGENYLFDSNNIRMLYCLYKSADDKNEITWSFLCIAMLLNLEKPTVTKVSEEQFKSLDKHDADIVICKDKTFLMKGTTNNNFIVDCSDLSPINLKYFVDIDYPEYYLSLCRNCSNCYNCRFCLNCYNCENSKSCMNCNTCTNCLNAFYCDNGINIFKKSDISNINKFKSNDYEHNDVNIYTKYVARFNTKTTKSNKKMYVAIIATAVVISLSIMGYIFFK